MKVGSSQRQDIRSGQEFDRSRDEAMIDAAVLLANAGCTTRGERCELGTLIASSEVFGDFHLLR